MNPAFPNAPSFPERNYDDQLRTPLAVALALHGGLAALAVFWGALGIGKVEHWGDPQSLGGGSVGITPVNRIPLPSRTGKVNPVANDTESQVPSAPVKPQPKPAVKAPPPDAIAIRTKNAPKRPAPITAPQKHSVLRDPRPNQVYSSTGQAAVSPLYSLAPGGGGVGSGSTSPFGNRFGWYEQILREKVARNWRSQDLDSRILTPVVVTFEILRNGTVRNVTVTRTSGNFTMDQSAQRAIMLSSPLPPLPPQYERDSAMIEFWFRLQQ